MQALYTHPLVCAHILYIHTFIHTRVQYRPHYAGPRDLCWNYFLFVAGEKGEVVRMKYDITSAVVFLCALLGPGCYPGFSFPWSLIDHVYTTAAVSPVNSVILGPVSQRLNTFYAQSTNGCSVTFCKWLSLTNCRYICESCRALACPRMGRKYAVCFH